MKKQLLSMFAMATMLLATGCSQEDNLVANSNDYVDVSFNIEMGEEVQSRALGDGVQVDQLYYGIFDQDGNVVPVITNVDNSTGNFTTQNVGEAVITGHTATVKMRLVKGQTYDFAFWAQVKGNEYYQIDMNNLSTISVNYNTAANDEKRDAFFGQLLDYTVESHFTKTVELRRPFAQLNVGTTLADYKAAEVLLGDAVTHSNLVVKKIPTQLNLLTGEVPESSNVTNVKFNMAELPQDINNPANNGAYEILQVDVNGDGKIAADASEDYIHLSMNYLLADVKGGSLNSYLYEADVEFANENGENIIYKLNVPNLPVYRNYRTNIIGSILTSTGEFTVIVVPEFYTPDIVIELWDGTAMTAVTEDNGVYSVSKASELAWIADQVNNKGNEFSGKTVKLTADINLNNHSWTPIGGTGTPFKGIFDGGDFTVSNLNVDAVVEGRSVGKPDRYTASGLLGKVIGTIQNVKVKNVTIKASHYAGAVVGQSYANITNCHVENVDIELSYSPDEGIEKNNGDKAGGIVGQNCEGNYTISKCTAKNVTIKGYRDLGGIIGFAHGGNKVEDNSVENVTIIVDKNNNYKGYKTDAEYHAGVVYGELGNYNNTLATQANNTSDANSSISYEGSNDLYKVDDNSYVATSADGLSQVNELFEELNDINVKVSSDIQFGEQAEGRSASAFQPLITIPAGKTLELDMNGMTLTGKLPDDYAGATSVFNVKKGATLNITGNGKFEVTAGRTLKYVSAIIINEGGIVTIESGDFNLKAGTYAEGYLIPTIVDNNSTLDAATLNIKGGTYSFFRNMFRNFSNHKTESATINIEGGTFSGTPDDWGAVWNQDPSSSNGEKAGIVNVTSGTFNYVNIDNEFATGNVKVEEGVAVVVTHPTATYTYDNTGLTQIDLTGDHTIVCGTDTYFGGATTPSLTINGKAENTLTFENSYRSYIKLANPEGKLVINDITVTQSKESGTWDEYNVIFMCDVECNDVTFAKSVAVEKNATFKGVTINETHDYYALWITADGQKVDIDGLTVNCAGRGIAIKDQYVGEPAKVKLNVSNATFKTLEKAAILVTSTAGADITLNNVDITNVTADQTNAVWVDNGRALNYDAVTVLGGSKIIEGTLENVEGVAVNEDDKNVYYIYGKAGLEWLANQAASAAYGSGMTFNLVTDVDLNSQEWTPIGGSGRAFQGIFDGHDHTISNLNITGYKSDVGLFGVTTNGEIRNLTVNNAKVSGRLDVGVVSGTPYTSKYTNIKVTGHVEVNGMSYVGAVGGKNAYANWTDVTIDVDGTSYVKANSIENGKAYRTYVGGACGFNGEGGHSFTNVKSNINVEGTTCDVGGLFGIAHYGNNFKNCSSSGNVTITKAADAEDAEEIGGIAGVWHNQNATTVTFDGCSYTGKLSTNIASVDLSDNTIHGKAYSATGTGQVIVK